MSDSFADLWNSTSTTNSKDIPLSQQKRGPTVQQKTTPDVFALLAQSSTGPRYGGGSRTQSSSTLAASSPGSRSLTPSYFGDNGVARPASSMSQSSTTKSGTGNDAFRDLFSGTSSSQSNGNTAHMTIAERAALVAKQRLAAQTTESSATPSTSPNQWAGLDALGAGSLSNNSIKPPPTTLDDDDWGLGDFGTTAKLSTQSKPTSQTKQADQDNWGLGDFAAPSTKQPVKQTSSQPTSKAASGSLWGLDGFSTPTQSQIHTDSPDFDFDFGNREDRDLSSPSWHREGEDDILGMLSKPVETVRAKQQQHPPTKGNPPPPSASSRISRTSSPPPHILGKIVEMGFSVSQGKAALAQTETGIDVQAALDILLAESNNDERRRPSPTNRENAGDIPSRQRPAASQREGSTSGTATPNTEKLIAQASEIGLSVLSKASLFWKEGKERVQKAYEEANASSTASGTRDNRPKWMKEASESPIVERHRYGDASRFKDDDDYSTSAFSGESAVAGSSHPIPPRHQPKVQEPKIDLFASAQAPEPKVYVSPFRRKKVETPSPATAPAPPLPRQQAQPPASPKPKRRLPFCASSTLTRVQQHKAKGTESFKLGQFSIAVEEYTKAITLLPTGHLLLIPLQTNRAISQIRCGECKAAIQDASGALSIIGVGWESWHPNDEDGGWELENDNSEADGRGGYTLTRAKGVEWSDTWGRGVDLKDAWVKAVKRRAEAFEGLEKWKDALKDWETLAGGGGGGWVDSHTRQEAVRGIGRCKKMFDGDKLVNGTSNQLTPVPTVKPRPRPTPTSQINAPPSVAVKAYRAQVSAAEAEDALKHSLKDAVEAKILAWKKGKETNLRALLASLDTVLWEEVINDMGKKPGMADLVSGGGVKKWYMKAVSRVHPDKLNVNNSSVEQRMIAGGVFGALNEAWLAFKQ